MMDAMRQSRKMDIAAFCAWIWNLVLLIPHSVAINLAYPQLILTQGAFHNLLSESICAAVSSKQQDTMTAQQPAVHYIKQIESNVAQLLFLSFACW